VTPVGDTHSINNEKPFELRLGRKFSASAFEDCIQTMKEGEKSLFLCVPDTIIGYNKMEIILRHIDYKTHLLENDAEINNKDDTDMAQHLINYKNQLCEKYHALTQSNIILLLEIELLDIQLPETFKKSIWEMNNEEKYKHATTLKDEGNHLFKSNEYNQASVKFQEALSLLQIMIHSGSLLNEKFSRQCTVKDTCENKEIKSSKKNNRNNEKDFNSLDKLISLCNICRLNYSACQLKLKNYQTVITNCTEVLKNDPENIKAYFRRGKAYSMLDSDLELAKKDFYKLKEIYVKHLEEEEEEGKLNTVLLPSSGTNNKLHFNFKDEIKNLNTEIKLLETKIKQKNAQQKSFFARLFSL
jgi:tetratricopeptide (TPR) repeat protein